MREREENHPLSISHPDYLVNPHSRTGKARVQSAKGEKDVDNAIESIFKVLLTTYLYMCKVL
jgi:hypothetical protein